MIRVAVGFRAGSREPEVGFDDSERRKDGQDKRCRDERRPLTHRRGDQRAGSEKHGESLG